MNIKNLILLNNYNVSVFKKSNIIYIYIYNLNYFCLIKLSTHVIFFLKNQKCLEIFSKNLFEKKYIGENFNFFIDQFFFMNFLKLNLKVKVIKLKKIVIKV